MCVEPLDVISVTARAECVEVPDNAWSVLLDRLPDAVDPHADTSIERTRLELLAQRPALLETEVERSRCGGLK